MRRLRLREIENKQQMAEEGNKPGSYSEVHFLFTLALRKYTLSPWVKKIMSDYLQNHKSMTKLFSWGLPEFSELWKCIPLSPKPQKPEPTLSVQFAPLETQKLCTIAPKFLPGPWSIRTAEIHGNITKQIREEFIWLGLLSCLSSGCSCSPLRHLQETPGLHGTV